MFKGFHECHHVPLSASFNYVHAALLKGIYLKTRPFLCVGANVNILDHR